MPDFTALKKSRQGDSQKNFSGPAYFGAARHLSHTAERAFCPFRGAASLFSKNQTLGEALRVKSHYHISRAGAADKPPAGRSQLVPHTKEVSWTIQN